MFRVSRRGEAIITEFNRSRAAALAALVREGRVLVLGGRSGRQRFHSPEWAANLRHNTPRETAATVEAFLCILRDDPRLRRMAAEQRIEVEELEDQLREFREREDLRAHGEAIDA